MRRGSLSSSGRCRRVPAAHSRRRESPATVVGLRGARARPVNVPGAVIGVRSVKGRGLPEERRQFAGAGNRDDAGGLAAVLVQVPPALVDASLGAPCDRNHAGVLGGLATCERVADYRPVARAPGRGSARRGAAATCRGGDGHASDRHGHPRSRAPDRGSVHRRPSARTRSAVRRLPKAARAGRRRAGRS